MDDALDRRQAPVADRIGSLAGRDVELGRLRHELPPDRVLRRIAVDQRRHLGRDRHRIARGDGGERAALGVMRHGADSGGRPKRRLDHAAG